jgi:hypothetical protein
MDNRDDIKNILKHIKLCDEKKQLTEDIDKMTKNLLEISKRLNDIDKAIAELSINKNVDTEPKECGEDFISTANEMSGNTSSLPDVGDNSDIWERMEQARQRIDAEE